MTNEEVKEVYARAEIEYELLKDRVHDQYDEIQQLKQRIDKAIEYIKNYLPNYDFDHSNLEKLLEILGDKE